VADTGSTSQQILAEIGLKLKSQRELLGLKLEDVERFTHVRLHYLQALEAGRLDLLPSPVQGRGMLNNYAHFLELDSDALLLRFADALQSRRVERAPQNPKGSPTAPTHKRAVQATGLRRFLTPDLVIGSSVILLLIVFAIWSAAQISSIRKDEIQPTVMGISDLVLTASPAALVTETGTPEPTTAGDTAVGGLNAPQATGTIPVIGDDPLQVYVIAKQRAWMRVSEDDQVKFMGRVSPGNAYTFSGTEKIELVTGNAAALQVFYNQNDLGFLGGIGQVATLLFTKDGIITPTAQYSPTPTVTPMLTITPSPSATVPSPTVTIYVP
jgi:cytoskeletal protein RodZ